MPLVVQGDHVGRANRIGRYVKSIVVERSQLCAAVDRNAVAAIEHFGRYADGAVLTKTGSSLLVASATTFPGAFHNAGIRVDPRADPRVVLTEICEFGATHHRDLVLWTSSHRDGDVARAAQTEGLLWRSTAVGMAIETRPRETALPAQAELVRVTDAEGVAAFADVHRRVFLDGGQSSAAVAHFASPGALLAPNVTAFIARMQGKAMACAMVISSGGEAGVYWVATRPEARNRGLGGLVTRVATLAGFEHGARVVVLQATKAGIAVYRRIGFADFTSYDRFVVPAAHRRTAP